MSLFFSCSKDKQNQKKGDSENIPTFNNIEFKNIFSKEDNFVKNEAFVKDSIDRYFQNFWQKGDLSGGLLVAKGDRIIYENYTGFARENKQNPINKNTALHIASISKSLTAMTILKLVEANLLSLDQKVADIFPKFPYKEIEIKHLLNHRSGLPKYEYFFDELKYNTNKKFYTNKDVLEAIIKYKPELARATNTGFMYCNTNYALLALVVEKICKKEYPVAIKEILFDPLEMKNTFVFQEKDMDKAARSFFYKDWKVYPYNNLDLIYGDKNIYSTPQDLFKFSKALYSKNFLKKELMDLVFTPYSNEKNGINNYGLGFRMKLFDNGKKLTYHNGWWHGSNSVFVHLLDSKTTIIAIGNRYSRKVYGSMLLSSLFEEFPFKIEHEKEELAKKTDSIDPKENPE